MLWLAAPVAFLGACDSGPSSSVDRTALTDTLAAVIADGYAFGSDDVVQRMASLYAPGERIVSATGGRLTVSTDSIVRGIERFWELAGQNMRGATWVWHEVYAEELGKDAAVLTGTWSIPHTAADGQPHIIEGAWTAVFRRLDGEWKIVHEHLSSPGS